MTLLRDYPRTSLVALLLAAVPFGCASKGDAPATRPATAPAVNEQIGGDLSNTDPCATRLHDLAGQLLLYYRFRGRLPDAIGDLNELDLAGLESPPTVCPKTDVPYVYNPRGIYLTDSQTYVILYDAGPYHSGYRWSITAKEATDSQGPTLKVIPLPERFFALRPPG